MASLFIVRSPGKKDFPDLSHLVEGRVYDGVPKADADRLIAATLAEEFDNTNELHLSAVEEFKHIDFKRGVEPAPKPVTKPAPKPFEAKKEDGK